MAAYMIADVDVKDAALFDDYRKQVPETLARHGGKYLVRGGESSCSSFRASKRRAGGTTARSIASRRRSA
jgi:uncharacterized protein (DUF1330 family)